MDPSALIREVKKRPLLWDQKNINYHNRTLADQEWTAVANELGEKKEVAKQKWKSLRDNYRKELKKYRRMEGIYTDDPPLPKWSRFQEMSFLTGIISTGGEGPVSASELVSVSLGIKREEEDSSVEMDEDHDESERMDETTYEKPEPFQRESYPRWGYQSDDNGDIHFLKSLLPFMKMLPPIKKLALRSEIHSLLIKEITSLQEQENRLEKNDNMTMDESVTSQSK